MNPTTAIKELIRISKPIVTDQKSSEFINKVEQAFNLNPVKIPLTKSKSSTDRYYLVSADGSMGNIEEPDNHANHKYQIVKGVDKGNGYQGYMSVSYFLQQDRFPQSAKDKITAFLKPQNLMFD